MCDKEKRLDKSHSYHTSKSPKVAEAKVLSKSELNFNLLKSANSSRSSTDAYSDVAKDSIKSTDSAKGEYYKKYEHDEVPVKDSNNNFSTYTRSLHRTSLTNSALENLERRIFRNVSQELQTDDISHMSLESNIKFFKTTVERIFESFYTSMRDFEHYKTRFHEILDKSKDGAVDDMEDFIKDMFDHIMSSDNSMTKVSRISVDTAASEVEDQDCAVTANSVEDSGVENPDDSEFVEAYKNDHYFTDSTLEDNVSKSSNARTPFKIHERFNVFLLDGNPCVEFKLAGRSLVSEVNVRSSARPSRHATTESVASADNFTKITAKKRELEKYIRQQRDCCTAPDKDIPVKVSSAKKDIHLNEDFVRAHAAGESAKSFLSKLCSIICRKFRKTSFAS